MAINTKRVIIAGLAAGLVMNILDFILNGFVFADRMKAEMNAFKPGMGDAMAQMDTNTIIGYVIMDFVLGMLLAYTYAAMRPRFGAGPKTSIIAAVVLWIFAGIISANYLIMGMMSQGLWWSVAIGYLVCLIIATLVAGAVYKEESTATV
jgi:peptidoglycan/LPS O-acetylase OafA/YrhL